MGNDARRREVILYPAGCLAVMRHDRWGGGAERTWGQRAFIVGALLVKVLLLYLIFG